MLCVCRKILQSKWIIPFIPSNLVNFNITNIVAIDVNFKILIKILLVLTFVFQWADNLEKLMGARIILNFTNW